MTTITDGGSVTYRPVFQTLERGTVVAEWCQWPPEVIWYAWPREEWA